jgi:hypothetical protein
MDFINSLGSTDLWTFRHLTMDVLSAENRLFRSEVEQVFQRDAESFGDAGAAFDGRGMDTALNKTDEFDGVIRLFRQFFLRKTFGFSQFSNPLT